MQLPLAFLQSIDISNSVFICSACQLHILYLNKAHLNQILYPAAWLQMSYKGFAAWGGANHVDMRNAV